MNIVVVVGIFITILTGIPVFLQLRSHPRGLFILFFAEMWERFSYYGMRSLLVLYLTQHFLFQQAEAGKIYGSYTSLVYLLPLIGGVLADRFLGTRKAVAFGALLLVAGHFLMGYEGKSAIETLSYGGRSYAVERVDGQSRVIVAGQPYAFQGGKAGGIAIKGLPSDAPLPPLLAKGSYETAAVRDTPTTNIFFLALSLIIMGVGFLKPNISTIVGQLYPQGDPRRDPGFTLYYYGVNLGAFWATAICGLLGAQVGWWAGFGLAGVGMLLGLVVFLWGRRFLEGHGEPPRPEVLSAPLAGPVTREWVIYGAGLLGVGGVWLLVQSNALVGWALGLGIAASLGYLGWFMAVKCERVARDRMILALVLIGGAIIFFTLFEQAGTSLTLFAENNVLLPHNGFLTVTTAQTQSFNAGFILIGAPIFASMWAALARRGRDPDPLIKFGLGLLQVGLGFFVIVLAAGTADANYRLPMIFLALLYLLHTTGELCLSPVGLSEITKLSVGSVVSLMMAVYFLASSIAQYVGGWIAALAGTETLGGQVLDPAAALATSVKVFNGLGWAGVIAGGVFFALSPLLKRLGHGIHDTRNFGVAPEPFAPTLDGERQAVGPAIVRAEQGGV